MFEDRGCWNDLPDSCLLNEALVQGAFPLQPSWNRQILGVQKVRVEQLRLVACAIVAQDCYDRVSRPEMLRKTDRACHIDTGRTAQAQAFLLQQIEDDRNRLLVRDLESHIRLKSFQILGNPTLANALRDRRSLCLQLAPRIVIVKGSSHRVSETNGTLGVTLLEGDADPGQRASRPD